MPQEGKPENSPAAPTDAQGTASQPAGEQPANPSVEMSDSVRSYLKGLGIEGVSATAELVKVAEAGMKQKESVSRMSLEKEQLLARLASQGKDTTLPEPEDEPAQKAPAKTTDPAPQGTEAKIGVSDNDLFDLSRMVITEFPELKDSAQDGTLFRELRQLGYFTSEGINKKSVYDYLAVKNSQAQELRELREFKAKYSQPDPSNNPIYNAQPGYDLKGEMNETMAKNIALSGDMNSPRYAEAIQFLRKQAYDSK